MKYHVELTLNAERDVESALEWFNGQDATAAGGRWFAQLMARIATLEANPERCAVAAESTDVGVAIRQLLFGKRHGRYRILFHVVGRTVYILRVRHVVREPDSRDDLSMS